jgi:hypothetical protein
MRRESESKSLCRTWISVCSTSVFTVAIIYFLMWNPALMKSWSSARESATHGDN